jgi:hypothetical protein
VSTFKEMSDLFLDGDKPIAGIDFIALRRFIAMRSESAQISFAAWLDTKSDE